MAGVKGRSGGPRANSGGARPNSGPKVKPPTVIAASGEDDVLRLLTDIAFGRVEANTVQVRAAVAAVQYTHTKKGDGGKKDEQADKAKKAGAGKFAAAAPPLKLVSR